MIKALHGGPWFILNHFLSVRKWEPKFIASSTQFTYSAIWVRLPELPTKFYDLEILQRVGSKFGHLLKVDTCTSTTTMGRYARICIELPLEKTLKTHVHIGHHMQILLYEGLNLLCTNCGGFGHAKGNCFFIAHISLDQINKNEVANSFTTENIEQPQETEWKAVNFARKANYNNKSNNTTTSKAAIVAAQHMGQSTPGKSSNPTRPSLGQLTLPNSSALKRPNKEVLNKFEPLADLGQTIDSDEQMSTSPTSLGPIKEYISSPNKQSML